MSTGDEGPEKPIPLMPKFWGKAAAPGLPSGNDPARLPEVKGWNWGAFLLPWLWPFAHRLHLWGISVILLMALSEVTPYVGLLGLAMLIYLGARGNAMAWEMRPFRDVAHLRATERVWAICGVCWYALALLAVAALRVRAYLSHRAIESLGINL